MTPTEPQNSEALPIALASSVQLTKNQKKKRRQKLSRKLRAFVAGPVPELASLIHEPSATAGHLGCTASNGALVQPSRLSVITLPAVDRLVSRAETCSKHFPEHPAATAVDTAAEDQQRNCPKCPDPAAMEQRVDFSHAAALIHAHLVGGPTLSPTDCSPATSGCGTARAVTVVYTHSGAAILSGHPDGSAAVATFSQQACVASSTVASTLTPATSGGPVCWAAVKGVTVCTACMQLPEGTRQGDACDRSDGQTGAKRKRGQGDLLCGDHEEEEDYGDAEAASTEDRGGAGESVEKAMVTAAVTQQVGQGGAGGAERERRRVYVYGNYHRYYGYRLGQAFGEDPRLQCFERNWFANRRCLDVGCNEGLVTLGIASKFGTKSMMGVDIDEHLIRKACMHLRGERSRAALRAVEVRRGGTAPAERRTVHAAHAALAQTWFVHADFVDSEGEAASFDTITCLSVLKWIHLNRGDAGLEDLLAKCWRLLSPGGYLVLEPQPWKSYKAAAAKLRKQPVSPSTYFHRLEELAIRPEELPTLLVDGLGFRLVKRLHPPSTTTAGFDRPMYLFRKPM